MGDIKIKITEITIPNDFRIYYKVGTDVVGLSPGINPYPLDNGYTDYGVVYSGGTETIDLIGDFNYGTQYWIMGKEIDYPERWMVKNILINDSIAYESFVVITPTPTPTVTPSLSISRTPLPTKSVSKTVTPSKTPFATPSITQTPSKTPSKTVTPSKTPSKTPTPSVTPSTPGQPVMITNFRGVYDIIGVSINGVNVTDVTYPIPAGVQDTGLTTQLGASKTVVVTLSGISNGEHIEVDGVCDATINETYKTFINVNTTNGVVIDYWDGPCP